MIGAGVVRRSLAAIDEEAAAARRRRCRYPTARRGRPAAARARTDGALALERAPAPAATAKPELRPGAEADMLGDGFLKRSSATRARPSVALARATREARRARRPRDLGGDRCREAERNARAAAVDGEAEAAEAPAELPLEIEKAEMQTRRRKNLDRSRSGDSAGAAFAWTSRYDRLKRRRNKAASRMLGGSHGRTEAARAHLRRGRDQDAARRRTCRIGSTRTAGSGANTRRTAGRAR